MLFTQNETKDDQASCAKKTTWNGTRLILDALGKSCTVIIEAAYKYFILPQLDLRVVKLYWHLSLVIYLPTREPKSRSVWRINIWLTGFKLFIEHYRFERAALVYLYSPYLPRQDVLMPVHHSSPQWDLQFRKQHCLMRRPWIHETLQSRCPHSVTGCLSTRVSRAHGINVGVSWLTLEEQGFVSHKCNRSNSMNVIPDESDPSNPMLKIHWKIKPCIFNLTSLTVTTGGITDIIAGGSLFPSRYRLALD